MRRKTGTRTRRRVLAFAAFMAAMSLAGPTRAQVFYTYPGAPPVKDLEPAVGANLGLGDNLLRIVGYGRFNINKVSDVGIEIVLDNLDGSGRNGWRIGAGGDYKYAIVPKENNLPFDLAVNGGFGLETGADFTSILIPLGAIISRGFEIDDGGRLVTPYGGVYMIIAHNSFDSAPGVSSSSKTDVDIELRAGGAVLINKAMSFYATLNVGAGTRFYLGINASL